MDDHRYKVKSQYFPIKPQFIPVLEDLGFFLISLLENRLWISFELENQGCLCTVPIKDEVWRGLNIPEEYQNIILERIDDTFIEILFDDLIFLAVDWDNFDSKYILFTEEPINRVRGVDWKFVNTVYSNHDYRVKRYAV